MQMAEPRDSFTAMSRPFKDEPLHVGGVQPPALKGDVQNSFGSFKRHAHERVRYRIPPVDQAQAIPSGGDGWQWPSKQTNPWNSGRAVVLLDDDEFMSRKVPATHTRRKGTGDDSVARDIESE